MKKLKYLYILAAIVVLPLSGFGQYLPQLSQLIKTLEFVNPGYNASKDHTSIVLMNRNQWVGFTEGTPKTYALNAHVPLNKYHLGIDANLYTETLGLRTQSNFDLGGNVDVKVSPLSYFTFGLMGGLEAKQFDFAKADWADATVPVSTDYNQYLFHAAAGLNFFAKNLHLGASMYYTNFTSSYYSLDERFTYYANGSYLIPIGNSWALKPAVLARVFTDQVDLDYGMFVLFKDIFWLGVTNRLNQAMIFMADVKITNMFRLGYSYDYSTSDLSNLKYNSHEIRLEFNLPKKKSTFERIIPN
jgi:type IX secretion system PorP/SprF family membrane protein